MIHEKVDRDNDKWEYFTFKDLKVGDYISAVLANSQRIPIWNDWYPVIYMDSVSLRLGFQKPGGETSFATYNRESFESDSWVRRVNTKDYKQDQVADEDDDLL